MTFEDFIAEAEANHRASDRQRRGQAYWNTLVDRRPDLARDPMVRQVDPFYSDGNLGTFLKEVERAW